MCSVFPRSTCRSVACDFKKTQFCLKSIFKSVFEQYNARVFKIPVLKRCTLSGSIFGNKSFVFMFKNSKAGLAFKC